MIGSAREGVVIKRARAALQPSQHARPRRFEQLELHRPACLLLDDHRTRPDTATADEVTDANLHHIATVQLAIDGQVEQSPSRSRRSRSSQNRMAHTCCASVPSWDRASVLRSKPAARVRPGRILNVPSLFLQLTLIGQPQIAAFATAGSGRKLTGLLRGSPGSRGDIRGRSERQVSTQGGMGRSCCYLGSTLLGTVTAVGVVGKLHRCRSQ